jgi:CRP/FNR family cyclic AMP-dependent transcriptional regulator
MPDDLTRKRKTPSKKGQAVSFLEGANLLENNDGPRQMYLLNSGQVRLTGRKGVIFDHLKRGSFIGEKSLLPAALSENVAMALSPVEAIALRKSDLMAARRQDHALTLRLVKDLAMRLDRYEELISDLVAEQAESRLARLLLRTAPARPAKGWVRLPFRFTNVELAKMVGTTRWRISHLLNRFQRLGWLRRDRHLWLRREGVLEYLGAR